MTKEEKTIINIIVGRGVQNRRGTFEVGERAAREGINPRTRETIKIAAAKTPKFKAGKQLKDSLN